MQESEKELSKVERQNSLPTYIWLMFIAVGLSTLTLLTYLASPRSSEALFSDIWFPSLVAVAGALVVVFPRKELLLTGSIVFALTTIALAMVTISEKVYGTFSFLFASWMAIEWYNEEKNQDSLLRNVVVGDIRTTMAIFTSTFIFGVFTELVNLRFGIWTYHMALPLALGSGIPILISAFGWTPWTLCILSLFYLLAISKDSRS